MKKKAFIIVVIIIFIAALITGMMFFIKGMKKTIQTTLYYISADGYGIEPIEKKIKYTSEKQIPADITELLKQNSGKLRPPVPKETIVNSISYDGQERMTVDLSDDFLGSNATENVLQTYALVKSFNSISMIYGVSEIRITVDSEPVKTVDGIEIGYINGSEIVSTDSSFKKISECILYYNDKKTKTLRGEKREIVTEFDGNPEKGIVKTLIEGPLSPELEKVISSDTELLSAYTVEGICYVNFKVYNEKINGERALTSVAKSLFSRNNISRVVIMVNGRIIKEISNDSAEGIR